MDTRDAIQANNALKLLPQDPSVAQTQVEMAPIPPLTGDDSAMVYYPGAAQVVQTDPSTLVLTP